MGEPVFIEFSENTFKIRKNLLIASAASLAVVIADLNIHPDSSFLGLKFHNLTDTVLTGGLIVVTFYLLLHFIWSAFDSLLEWWLRLTGTRVAFITVARAGSEHGDHPDDPRQSTFYNWWLDQARQMDNFSGKISQIESQLSNMDTLPFPQVLSSIRELGTQLDAHRKVFESKRIMVSLSRFDKWFEFFLRSQNLRWLIIEFLFPLILAGYALLLLFLR